MIICLPGFGRPASDFEIFIPLLDKTQKIIAVNLFAHGGSTFPELRLLRDPLRKSELAELMVHFMKHLGVDQVHITGYSLGGRIALTLCEIIPERIRTVLLIAPDGLKKNWLYMFVTGTSYGRSLYLKCAENPETLFRFAGALNKLGLLPDKLHRFVHVHLETRNKRMQVFETWMTYRRIFPQLRKVSKNLSIHNIRLRMIFGRYDSVIRTRLGRKFVRITGDQTMLHILPLGHRMMNETTVSYIRNHQLWP